MANVDFEASCDLVGNIIYCSINTDIENSEYAFYIILDGERKATFWYTTRPKIEYNCGNEIFSTYEIVFFVRSIITILLQNPSQSDQIGQYVMVFCKP